MYEERILLLERDLEVLSIAQAQLGKQKQQIIFLKELTGKAKFDMDRDDLEEGDTADENEDKVEGEDEEEDIQIGACLSLILERYFIYFSMIILTKSRKAGECHRDYVRMFDELKKFSDDATQYASTLFVLYHTCRGRPILHPKS